MNAAIPPRYKRVKAIYTKDNHLTVKNPRYLWRGSSIDSYGVNPKGRNMAIQALREDTIVDVIDRILDKGVMINADISISLAGTELLGIKIKAAISSFETAAKYGLEFPSGANLNTPAWKDATALKEDCPRCNKKQPVESLLNKGCIWCGWRRKVVGDSTLSTT